MYSNGGYYSNLQFAPYAQYNGQNYPQTQPAVRYDRMQITPPAQESDNPAKTAGMALLLQGMTVMLDKGSGFLSRKFMRGKEFTTFENIEKVAKHMTAKNKLGVEIGFIDHTNLDKYVKRFGEATRGAFTEVADGKNAFFSDVLNLCVAPKSKPSLLPHELGHATAAAKKGILNLMRKSKYAAVYAPMVLLLASKIAGPKEDGSPNFIERNAGVLGFCAYLPKVIEEAAASIRGYMGSKEALKGLGKTINYAPLRNNYLVALGTYVLGAIAVGIASKQMIINNK